MKLGPLTTPDGRRAYAFAGVMGGCVVMTIFAAIGVYLTSGNVTYSFYLALAAHAQILVGLTALGAQFVKRNISIGKDGLSMQDQPDVIHDGDPVTLNKGIGT